MVAIASNPTTTTSITVKASFFLNISWTFSTAQLHFIIPKCLFSANLSTHLRLAQGRSFDRLRIKKGDNTLACRPLGRNGCELGGHHFDAGRRN